MQRSPRAKAFSAFPSGTLYTRNHSTNQTRSGGGSVHRCFALKLLCGVWHKAVARAPRIADIVPGMTFSMSSTSFISRARSSSTCSRQYRCKIHIDIYIQILPYTLSREGTLIVTTFQSVSPSSIIPNTPRTFTCSPFSTSHLLSCRQSQQGSTRFTMRLQLFRNFLARILNLYWDSLLFRGGPNFLYGLTRNSLYE